ncbi:hypothetical protein ElyMa_002755500 [Elysia marginata]|uniref:Uncharacterized protein n=1 Tax=Elysia marginata TaxID=1093978 RepID=A0AAV4HL32_9GAST|nr:hypothetical protein ElyMa_002755500 [Elysia marginata]
MCRLLSFLLCDLFSLYEDVLCLEEFQDYIKSLQRQPESPHMPEKSPSNSILKPGVSPVASDVLVGKKKSPKVSPKKSPKKRKNAKGDARSPSPSPGKVDSARSRSNFKMS